MINVIGIGLQGANSLTPETLGLIEHSTVLVGSDRHLGYFPDYAGERLVLGDFLAVFSILKEKLAQAEKVVILVSGDPLFFGLGRLLIENFLPEQLTFYPHLSSIQLAFNRLQLTWQDAEIVSIHGRSLELLMAPLQKGVKKLAILTDHQNHPGAIAAFVRCLHLPIEYDFWVCEDLGSSQEKIHCYTVEDLERCNVNDFSGLNIVVLVCQEKSRTINLDLKRLPLLGIPDHLFLSFEDRPGLMTKREIRIQILAELALQSEQVIWDVGAGTGSVSIEIARLCPSSPIYSIEKSSIGITLIKQNCQRFQTQNIIPIPGNAPKILENLPSPDRIFMGGSGGNLLEILNACQKRLKPSGKMVLALATLENLATSLDWFKTHQWDFSIQHLQITRSLPFANLTRLNPLNPVYLITGEPPTKSNQT